MKLLILGRVGSFNRYSYCVVSSGNSEFDKVRMSTLVPKREIPHHLLVPGNFNLTASTPGQPQKVEGVLEANHKLLNINSSERSDEG